MSNRISHNKEITLNVTLHVLNSKTELYDSLTKIHGALINAPDVFVI